ncbi:class F sortase [Streptomyces sp. HUAS ZL42]|uniref:class F sortase n=1 Tax=Streptomyces sp. HUAS ZL42 TaxID=3231715 RepID=UPI00345E4617
MAANPPSSPGTHDTPSGRSSRMDVTMFWGVALLALALFLAGGHDDSSDGSRVDGAAPGPTSSLSAPKGAGKHLPRSKPTRLVIPKIWVDAPFTDLVVNGSGRLEPPPPADTNLVGWYAGGASPGEAGTAIIAGHVDTATSAAVFANLRELKKGDRFHITRTDGHTAHFVVDSAETFDKDHFPDQRVYADTRQAQVRLITCAGSYDHKAKDYTENLVVFGHLV